MPPRGIGIYLVIALIIAGAIYFLYPRNATTSVVHSVNTTQSTSSIPRQTVSTIPPSNTGSCQSPDPTVAIYNGNFSTGTYAGWNTTGLGFQNAPANITSLNNKNAYYESPWAGYNGTYFATTYREGTLVATGNLTSNPFVVTEPYLNFKVVSPQNNFLYVEILHNGAPALTVHLNTYSVQGNLNSTSTFQNASILMVPFLCQNVQIRIVADVVGTTENTYQFIAVTNFTQAKRPILTQGIIVNQTYS